LPAPPTVVQPAPILARKGKRFAVALSFPGEHRSYISKVAERLGEVLQRTSVFYDKWYEHELARPISTFTCRTFITAKRG
jgi:hypothetical protein